MRAPNRVTVFAKELGYDKAKYLCQWDEYAVFEPIWDDDVLRMVGLPVYILYCNGAVRLANNEEMWKIREKFVL